MRWRIFLFVALAIAPLSSAIAQSGAFCRGFSEGFKAQRGDIAIVPICPIEPIVPIGSTSFREGIKAGMEAGAQRGGPTSGGRSGDTQDVQASFCSGFSEGWKSVKGDLAIVPICPIAPITPIGSNPYREGLKAGVRKGQSR